TLKWKLATKARVVSSPAVQDGAVYFESYDSHLYAVDAASGLVKWKFATKGEKRFSAAHIHGIVPESEVVPDPFDFYLSSPAFGTGAFCWAGEPVLCTPSMGRAAPGRGPSRRGTSSTPRPPLRTVRCTSGVGIVTSMRSTRQPERRSGASRPA